MATTVKGQLVTKDTEGNKYTNNFNNLNPEATDEQLATVFGTLAGLQSGTVVSSKKIVTTEIEPTA